MQGLLDILLIYQYLSDSFMQFNNLIDTPFLKLESSANGVTTAQQACCLFCGNSFDGAMIWLFVGRSADMIHK